MSVSVREELHKIIDEADDIQLNEIYDWLHEGVPEAIQYTQNEIDGFYNRLSDHEEGNSKSYTLGEFFDLVRNKG